MVQLDSLLERYVQDSSTQATGDIFGAIQKLDFTRYVDSMFNRIPQYLQPWFQEERAYAGSLTHAFQQDVQELLEEKAKEIRDHPDLVLERSPQEWIQFSDLARQQRFVGATCRKIEDLAYAIEVAAFEAYRILEVKRNTPIVGYFARKKIAAAFPEGLPKLGEVIGRITAEKQGALTIFGKLNSNLQYQLPLSNVPGIRTRYQQQASQWKAQVAADYNQHTDYGDLEAAVSQELPDNPGKRFRAEMQYSLSPYNSFFEKCLGVAGAVANYFISVFE